MSWKRGDPTPAMQFFPPARPIPAFYFGPIPQKKPVAVVHYLVHDPNAAPRA